MTLPVRRSGALTEAWRPPRELEDLYAEMDRFVQSLIGDRADDGRWMPAGDVIETDGAYIVEIELPGVRSEDVDVQLNGNELVVAGELKERKREGLFRRRTRRVGEFEYRVTLPGDLQQSDVEASLAHGVLRVHVPKAHSSTSRKIAITKHDGSH
jgi:HSP20 family protein